MSTQKQIEANRRNAQKSTGPQSPETKAKTRLNAMRDGFTGHLHRLLHRQADGDGLDGFDPHAVPRLQGSSTASAARRRPAGEVYRGGPHGDKRRCQETAASDALLFTPEHG